MGMHGENASDAGRFLLFPWGNIAKREAPTQLFFLSTPIGKNLHGLKTARLKLQARGSQEDDLGMAIETTGMQRDDVTGEHLLRVQQKPMPLLPGLLGTTHKKWMTDKPYPSRQTEKSRKAWQITSSSFASSSCASERR